MPPKKLTAKEEEAKRREEEERAAQLAKEEAEEALRKAEELANGCLWKDLKRNHIEELVTTDIITLERRLVEILDIKDAQNDMHNSIRVDFYVQNFSFAKDHGFSVERLSAFFSIMKDTLDFATTQLCDLSVCFDLFKSQVLKHSIARPPDSFKIFDVADAKLVTDYATKSFFQHFSLYQHVFSHEQAVIRESITLTVETVYPPLPLASAETEQAFTERIAAEKVAKERAEQLAAAEAEKKAEEQRQAELEAMEKEDKLSKTMTELDELLRPPLTPYKVKLLSAQMVASSIGQMKDSLLQTLATQNAEMFDRIAALEKKFPEPVKKK